MQVVCTITLLLAVCSQCFANSGVKVNVSVAITGNNILAAIPPGVRNRIRGAIHYCDSVL